MPDPHTACATARTAYRAFGDLARQAGAGALDRATQLRGWQVRDLVAHVAWGQAMQADAVRRLQSGDTRPAGAAVVDPGQDAATLLDALDAAHRDLAGVLDVLAAADPQRPVTLPTSTMPAAALAVVIAFEASLHSRDLAHALGGPAALSADGLAAVAAFTPAYLQFAGALGEPAADGTSYALAGDTFRVDLLRRDGQWRLERDNGDAATAGVGGTDEAVLLFVHGRLDAADAGLRVTGDPRAAAAFKRYFPGP